MAAHRFWRLVGFSVPGGPLELSEARLYAAGVPADAGVMPTCTFSPTSGSLAALTDGVFGAVAAWEASAHRSAGFALLWDLGAAPAAIDGVQLGSGASSDTFPTAVTLQWSDDGLIWASPSAGPDRILFPGPHSPTAAAESSGASSLLHFDGANSGTYFADETGKPWTASNGACTSTAWAKFGSASLDLGGTRHISTPSTSDFDFGAGDFTIAFWLNLRTNYGSNYGALICRDNISVERGWLAITGISGDGGAGVLFFAANVGSTTYIVSDTQQLATGPQHIVIGRDNGYLRLYKNGQQVAQTAISGSINAPAIPVYIGTLVLNGSPFSAMSPDGYMDELSVSKSAIYPSGVAFVPPSSPGSATTGLIALDPNAKPAMRSTAPAPDVMAGSGRAPGACAGHPRERVFADAYHGGVGRIYGTVKEKHTPDNTPLRRRVLLIDERSHLTIRETWSDAATGAYEFRGVKMGVPYTVLSYDLADGQRAVVADLQFPELMA